MNTTFLTTNFTLTVKVDFLIFFQLQIYRDRIKIIMFDITIFITGVCVTSISESVQNLNIPLK